MGKHWIVNGIAMNALSIVDAEDQMIAQVYNPSNFDPDSYTGPEIGYWFDKKPDGTNQDDPIAKGTPYCADRMNRLEMNHWSLYQWLIQKGLPESGGGAGGIAYAAEIEIPQTGWKTTESLDASENVGYYNDVKEENSNRLYVPMVFFHPAAKTQGILGICKTENGYVRFYSTTPITQDIKADLVLMGQSSGSSGTITDLPVATETRLGGVMIGEGVDVTEQGLISVDVDDSVQNNLEQRISDDSEMSQWLDETFGGK